MESFSKDSCEITTEEYVHIASLRVHTLMDMSGQVTEHEDPVCSLPTSSLLSSLQFSHLVMSNSLWPHGLQHTRPPCPSPTPRIYSNSCPSSLWCYPTISSSVIPFSSCLQFFPASRSFQMSQFFASGGQSIGVSASTWEFQLQHKV